MDGSPAPVRSTRGHRTGATRRGLGAQRTLLIERFGDAPEPEIQMEVARARKALGAEG